MKEVHLTVIPYRSNKYAQACELRNAILREPLGLSLYDENLSEENNYTHYGAFENEMIVACLIAIPHSIFLAQIRQMAVSEDRRKMGVGRQLMQYAEKDLLQKGFRKIFLHARKKAVSFYLKLGYRSVGDEFEKLSIPHQKMEKIIHKHRKIESAAKRPKK